MAEDKLQKKTGTIYRYVCGDCGAKTRGYDTQDAAREEMDEHYEAFH